LVQEEKHYRYLSEQVCHHPPISACYCEGVEYEFWTEVFVKSKFWGKSLELHPLGACHVTLPVYGNNNKLEKEHYSWKKVTTCVNNLILGTLQIEHYGDLVVKNHRTGEECIITFKAKEGGGWFGGGSAPATPGGGLVGVVKDRKGVIRYELKGRWDESLSAYPVGQQYIQKPFTAWKINPKPTASKENFKFTNFAMMLNQSSDELAASLPLTDSRLRPDQKAMERGLWDEADRLKESLELRQRAHRKHLVHMYEKTNVKSGPPPKGIEFGEAWWQPRWFIKEIEQDTGEEHWRFTGDYWDHRKKSSWPDYVTDIFGIKGSTI
jgi:oxysterol-binding protein 1